MSTSVTPLANNQFSYKNNSDGTATATLSGHQDGKSSIVSVTADNVDDAVNAASGLLGKQLGGSLDLPATGGGTLKNATVDTTTDKGAFVGTSLYDGKGNLTNLSYKNIDKKDGESQGALLERASQSLFGDLSSASAQSLSTYGIEDQINSATTKLNPA